MGCGIKVGLSLAAPATTITKPSRWLGDRRGVRMPQFSHGKRRDAEHHRYKEIWVTHGRNRTPNKTEWREPSDRHPLTQKYRESRDITQRLGPVPAWHHTIAWADVCTTDP